MIKHISNHPQEYFDLFKDLYENEGTLRIFINNIRKLSNKISFYSEDERLKFKGDSLEILSELFFNAFKNDEAVGITEYIPVPLDEDFGVDAHGINANGHKAMIQVKYRENPKEIVTYAEISRTFASGVINFGLDPTQDYTLFVFTTANDVSIQCKTVFGKRLHVISKEIIKNKIDNNKNFWKFAYNTIFAYLNSEDYAEIEYEI